MRPRIGPLEPGLPVRRTAARHAYRDTAVAEYLRDYTDHVDLRAITSRTVHQTVDPDVVVVEFEVAGTAVRTGRPYRMRYIAVITVRDGEITGYRDYWSPLAAAEALGGAEDLTAFAGGAR